MNKMVAIIGATGNAGSTIALGLAAANYRVLLTDEIEKHPFLYVKLLILEYRIRLKSSRVDVELVLSEREASWEADIVILAVPFEAQPEIALKIKDVVTGKIVISMIDAENKAKENLVTVPTGTVAGELQQLLPYSKIVKAFNPFFNATLKKPQVARQIIDVFVAGDDKEAVSTVKQLARDMGFNPLSADTLDMSRILNNRRGPNVSKALQKTVDQDERKILEHNQSKRREDSKKKIFSSNNNPSNCQDT